MSFADRIGTKTSGGVWRREFPEVALKFPLRFPGRVLESGVRVAEGTRGAIVVEGVLEEALEPGRSGQKPKRSLVDRIFKIEGDGSSVEALLACSENFNVPILIDRGIRMNSGGELQASVELTLKVVEMRKIYSSLLVGRSIVTSAHLASELLPLVTSALGSQLSALSREILLAKRYDVGFFEAPIRGLLEPRLRDLGLEFVRLHDIAVIGSFLDQAITHATEEMLNREGLLGRFQKVRDEHELAELCGELESAGHLSAMQRREMKDSFAARSHEKVRSEDRITEENEARHESTLKKIKHETSLEISTSSALEALRLAQEALRLKNLKTRAENDIENEKLEKHAAIQIRLVKELDGRSRDAILASAGAEVRRDMILLAQVEVGALVKEIPSLPIEIDFRGDNSRFAGNSFNLDARRKAVGLIYAGIGAECLAQIGTAWAVAANKVVTNAHVAFRAMEYMKEGITVWVRMGDERSGPIEVISARIHPDFQEHLHRTESGEHAVPGCDLAVLELDGICTYTLTTMSTNLLPHLKVGEDVSYLGFPSEGLPGGGANHRAPSPIFKSGKISNLTDFSFAAVDPRSSCLITHDMGVAGGASGSPLMDYKGNVIGVVSAGTMHSVRAEGGIPDEMFERIPMQRIPSGVLVNFAQRIDLLKPLL